MKKYLIDATMGIVSGAIILVIIPYYLFDLGAWIVSFSPAWKELASRMPGSPDPGNILLLIYAIAGIVLFGIYKLTPFYKNRHEGNIRSTLISLIIFTVGVEVQYFTFLIIVASSIDLFANWLI